MRHSLQLKREVLVALDTNELERVKGADGLTDIIVTRTVVCIMDTHKLTMYCR